MFCVHPTGGRDSFDTVSDYMDGGEEEEVGDDYDVDDNDEYEYDYLDDDENYFGGIEEEEEVKLNEKDDTTSKHTNNTNESFHIRNFYL